MTDSINQQIQKLRDSLYGSDETFRLMSAGFVDRADVECALEQYEDTGISEHDFDMDEVARCMNNALMQTWNEILGIVIGDMIDFGNIEEK